MNAWRALFLCLFFLGSAFAANKYAEPGGTGSVCSSGNRCSLQQAIDDVGDGDSVLMASGTYTGSYVISGTPKTFTLDGTAGGVIVDPASTDARAFNIGDNSGQDFTVTFSGFTIQGAVATSVTGGAAIFIDEESTVNINAMTFTNNDANSGGAVMCNGYVARAPTISPSLSTEPFHPARALFSSEPCAVTRPVRARSTSKTRSSPITMRHPAEAEPLRSKSPTTLHRPL